MYSLNDWQSLSKDKRQAAIKQLIHGSWPPATDYIDLVMADNNQGVYASTGPHFINAIFGRDSLEVAEDLLDSHQTLVKNILLTLASLQGVKFDQTSEEEPGKIHHEYRSSHIDNRPSAAHSLDILHTLQKQWGGEGTDYMIYYGSHDATLLFVRLIDRYVTKYGQDILEQTYVGQDNQTHSLKDSAQNATRWIVSKVDSDLGLFIYKRLNPNGIANQTWKDSQTAFMYSDGTLPNFDKGIASVELQGYAYDALTAAVRLGLGDEKEQDDWRKLAANIQQQTLTRLWMPEQHFFAQGLAYDSQGQLRQLDTLTSDAGVLLETAILHDLPQEQGRPLIEDIAKTICSEAFLTKAGIRCRALIHWHLPGFIDYHGTSNVWPKETLDISKGLRRSGHTQQADMLDGYLLDSLEQAGEFYEFFYVSRDGKVWYDLQSAMAHFESESPGQTLPIPEPGQAWTISAVDKILYKRSNQ